MRPRNPVLATQALATRGLAIRGLAIRGLAIRGLAIRGLAIRGLAILGLGLLSLTSSLACNDDDSDPPADAGQPDAAPADATVDAAADDAAEPDAAPPDAGGKSGKLVILHTNDIHSTVEGGKPVADYTPLTTGDDSTHGGFARLATVISKAKADAGDTPVLLLDAGDFSMGTPFDMLGTATSPVLMLMQQLGYDAITLGNHEFEGSPALTAKMIDAAAKAGFSVPLLVSNLRTDGSETGDDGIEALLAAGTLQRKLVKTLPNGLKVGLFGLVGDKAWGVAYGLGVLKIEKAEVTAKAMVDELRNQDGVDLVICISHSGLSEDGKGPDAELAAAVPGIDVIVGGHSHTALTKPVVVGDTVIVQAGAHADHLGRLELELQGGKLSVTAAELLAVDDSVAGDATVDDAVQAYVAEIDALLAADGLAYGKVLAETSFDLDGDDFTEQTVGNLVTDGYRHSVTAVDPAEPVDIALESNGVIGDPILAGKTGQVILADVYRAVHAGYGPDGQIGFPLVSFYVNGKDIKNALEVLAHAEDALQTHDYFFQLSGLKVSYSLSASGLFQRVTSAEVGGQPVDFADTTKCYRLVTSLLLGLWIDRIQDASYGLLKAEAKQKDCKTLVTDMVGQIVDADPAKPGLQELKAWRAVVDLLGTFADGDGDGVPEIPQSYAAPEGRINALP